MNNISSTMKNNLERVLRNDSEFRNVSQIVTYIETQKSWKLVPLWLGLKSHYVKKFYATAHKDKSLYCKCKDRDGCITDYSYFDRAFKVVDSQCIGSIEYDCWNSKAFLLYGLAALSASLLYYKGSNPLSFITK